VRVYLHSRYIYQSALSCRYKRNKYLNRIYLGYLLSPMFAYMRAYRKKTSVHHYTALMYGLCSSKSRIGTVFRYHQSGGGSKRVKNGVPSKNVSLLM
jgi:hypothetical protein